MISISDRRVAHACVIGAMVLSWAAHVASAQQPNMKLEPDDDPMRVLGVSPIVARPMTQTATSPAVCDAIVQRLQYRATRSAPAQQAEIRRHVALADTVESLSVVVDSARACLQLWNPATTPRIDLPNLIQLALTAGAYDKATAAATRWLATIPSVDTLARANGLAFITQLLLAAQPRTAQRDAMVAQYSSALRRLGGGGKGSGPRLSVLNALLIDAFNSGDPLRSLAAADSLRRTILALPSLDDRDFFEGGTALLTVNLHKAIALGQLPAGRVHTPSLTSALSQGLRQWQEDAAQVPRLRATAVPTAEEFIGGELSVPVPSFGAVHWFDRADSLRPPPHVGVPTLVLAIEHNCGGSCAGAVAAIQHLYDEFAPKGVAFVVIGHTDGYFRHSARLSPALEMDSLRHYVKDVAHIPGSLGVTITEFERLSDGRQVPKPAPASFGSTGSGLIFPILITDAGTVLVSGGNLFGGVIGEARGDVGVRQFIETQMHEAPGGR